MFTNKFVARVTEIIAEGCTATHGMSRKAIAEKLAADYPQFAEAALMAAVTIVVPVHVPGYRVSAGRGGGFRKLSSPEATEAEEPANA